MEKNSTFYKDYERLYKAWEHGDILFETKKPFNYEGFLRSL